MQNIEKHALQTYQANLKYLEENHKSLYAKINLLNSLIENGSYIEKYALEYKEDGYFDILELSTGEFLYKENSISHAERMVEMIDLKRTGAIFKAQKLNGATEQQAEIIDKSELSFHNALWATIKLTNYVSTYASPDTYMKHVYKVIFLDIGLGLHLKGIIEKLNSKIIFIKEKNLETFRLSLFTVNYKELSANRFIYFSITNSETEESESFINFLDKGNNYNLHLKHIPFMPNYQLELQKLQSFVLSQPYVSYGYSAILLRYIDSPRYLVRGYSFLNVNKRYENNIFSNKPILLLFSGPSTSKNIKWVKENKDRFIVISALSTCRLLHSENITPDIVMHIDPGENTSLLFEGINHEEYFKNITLILSSNVDEKTILKFNRSKIHLIEQGTKYKQGFGQLSAPSVGEYTYGLSLLLGATDIFMLGIDLALDNETFQSHGGFHPYDIKGEIDDKSSSLDPNTSLNFVKGNFIDQVPSNSVYKISILQFEYFTEAFKSDLQHVYNLSNGAYLKGSEPFKIEAYNWSQFNKLDKAQIQKEINNFLNDIGSDDFNNEDSGQLKYQIKEAKKLEKIIKQFKKKKFLNAEAYLDTLSKLSWDLSDMDYKRNSDLAQVYYEYFQAMQSYIFDLFNTQELMNPNKHVAEINKILINQLLKISNLYITKMESYLK